MFLLDGTVVTSPSDLTLASSCEFAFALQLDARLGKVSLEKVERDPIEARAAELGDVHENRQLETYRAEHGHGVVALERPAMTREALRAADAATRAALESRAPVVFQATFFDETGDTPLIGFADFLVRRPDGRYRVQDTKLARRVKVPALLQLAAYHGQLERMGIPADDTVELLLGTGEISSHAIDDIAPVYAARRARLREIVSERLADPDHVHWGDDRYAIDGRCPVCDPLAVEHRDVLLTAGLRLTQRARLRAAGIPTIDALAAAEGVATGIPARTFEALRQQAQLQLAASTDPHGPPPVALIDASAIGDLPLPDDGDIFFDFEGDPLASEPRDGETVWGLDYLFGLVDRTERFTPYWAHSLAEEREALIRFLDDVAERRRLHPGMHVYHYAAYERTHLLSLAARHGVGEDAVDGLLRDGVLVDLYPVVRRAVRIGGRSYSLKKLEPLYMGDELRADDGVTTAGDSIIQYGLAQDARVRGDDGEAQRILDDIADYNRYDCVSTLRLHAWLVSLAAEAGVTPGAPREDDARAPFEPSPLAETLAERARVARHAGDLTAGTAYDLVAAAVDYHRREDKSFWWGHYARLEYPVDEWTDERDVFTVASGETAIDWAVEGRARRPSRVLALTGDWSPGSRGAAREAFALYEAPGPFSDPRTPHGHRLALPVSDVATADDGTVTVTERCPEIADPWRDLPIALTPGPPPRTQNLKSAIEEVGSRLATLGPGQNAIDDLLWMLPARVPGGPEPVAHPDGTAAATVASLARMDRGYLAVQGPPGTGKTHLAASVIADLVRREGWRVGVVAQSHKVVENVLRKLVSPDIGLDPRLVGKALADGADDRDDPGYTIISRDAHLDFARSRHSGYVIGGSAWDVTNPRRFARDQLDLLVIDEAGQFSLAATIAVSVVARRLLLLGDPQQLPQVSQGTHPAPVDQSALGFLADGRAVLPPEHGYFLERSRRMVPEVAETVSRLSYDGELRSHPVATERSLDAVAPGLTAVPVEHQGNATQSREEAATVVALAQHHLGRSWTSEDSEPRPLDEGDIIVVTPYNAQADLVRAALDEAGLAGVRVGTVDKFQGQEAVISIVSLAASSAEDVPRGVDFLLNRNRLNVAISRAQWAAYLVYSPGLTRYLPERPDGVAQLSRFLRLVS